MKASFDAPPITQTATPITSHEDTEFRTCLDTSDSCRAPPTSTESVDTTVIGSTSAGSLNATLRKKTSIRGRRSQDILSKPTIDLLQFLKDNSEIIQDNKWTPRSGIHNSNKHFRRKRISLEQQNSRDRDVPSPNVFLDDNLIHVETNGIAAIGNSTKTGVPAGNCVTPRSVAILSKSNAFYAKGRDAVSFDSMVSLNEETLVSACNESLPCIIDGLSDQISFQNDNSFDQAGNFAGIFAESVVNNNIATNSECDFDTRVQSDLRSNNRSLGGLNNQNNSQSHQGIVTECHLESSNLNNQSSVAVNCLETSGQNGTVLHQSHSVVKSIDRANSYNSFMRIQSCDSPDFEDSKSTNPVEAVDLTDRSDTTQGYKEPMIRAIELLESFSKGTSDLFSESKKESQSLDRSFGKRSSSRPTLAAIKKTACDSVVPSSLLRNELESTELDNNVSEFQAKTGKDRAHMKSKLKKLSSLYAYSDDEEMRWNSLPSPSNRYRSGESVLRLDLQSLVGNSSTEQYSSQEDNSSIISSSHSEIVKRRTKKVDSTDNDSLSGVKDEGFESESLSDPNTSSQRSSMCSTAEYDTTTTVAPSSESKCDNFDAGPTAQTNEADDESDCGGGWG